MGLVGGSVGVGGRRAVGEAKAVEAQSVVGVRVVGDEHQHPKVVGQDVGQLEPRGVVVEPLPAGLLGLVPADGKADGVVDYLWRIAGLDDDDLEDFPKGSTSIGVHLPDPQADQGAEVGVQGRVSEGGCDRVSIGE